MQVLHYSSLNVVTTHTHTVMMLQCTPWWRVQRNQLLTQDTCTRCVSVYIHSLIPKVCVKSNTWSLLDRDSLLENVEHGGGEPEQADTGYYVADG